MGIMGIMMMQIQVAAAAAAQARRDQEEEEETMTSYTSNDVNGNWEFKIVRAPTAVFRSQERLERLIEEEAVSGWEMLEKLDDRRIRFKRSKKARDHDKELPASVNPYRTQYATEEGIATMAAVVLIVLFLVPLMLVGAMFVAVLVVLLTLGLVLGAIWLAAQLGAMMLL